MYVLDQIDRIIRILWSDIEYLYSVHYRVNVHYIELIYILHYRSNIY